MIDLTTRLRIRANQASCSPSSMWLMNKAATEIERLQARNELLEKVVEKVLEYELRVDKKDWRGRTIEQIAQAIEIARLEMFLQVTMLENQT